MGFQETMPRLLSAQDKSSDHSKSRFAASRRGGAFPAGRSIPTTMRLFRSIHPKINSPGMILFQKFHLAGLHVIFADRNPELSFGNEFSD